MKKFISLVLTLMLVLFLVSCGQTNEDTAVDEQIEDVLVVDVVKPLDNTVDTQDCMISVLFDADDIETSEDSMQLTVEIYDYVMYDAVDVSMLAEGKTIVDESGNQITIESIEDVDGYRNINGGVENGGMSLCPIGGGVYQLATPTEYNIMVSVGTQTYPISADCTIVDSADLDNPNMSIALADFVSLLNDDTASFNQFNTIITVEDGVITNIQRNYMP